LSVTSVVFSTAGHRLAAVFSLTTVRLWNSDTGACIATLTGHPGSVTSVALSVDGSRLASISHGETVRLWDGKKGASIATLEGHSDRVTSVAFSMDGSRLASASQDKTVRLWDNVTGTFLAMYHCVAFDLCPSSHLNLLFLLVHRTDPFLYGLVTVRLSGDNSFDAHPFCWFPPDWIPESIAVNTTASFIAVRCADGRNLVLNTSQVVFP
jgi:WD40 repeat protein